MRRLVLISIVALCGLMASAAVNTVKVRLADDSEETIVISDKTVITFADDMITFSSVDSKTSYSISDVVSYRYLFDASLGLKAVQGAATFSDGKVHVTNPSIKDVKLWHIDGSLAHTIAVDKSGWADLSGAGNGVYIIAVGDHTAKILLAQ